MKPTPHVPVRALLCLFLLCLAGCTPASSKRTLTAVVPIESPTGPGSGEPCLVVAGDGRVGMSWFEALEDGQALRMAWLNGETWSAPVTIASGDSFFVNWADFPRIMPLPDGTLAAHYPWMSGSGTYSYDVIMRFSSDDGATWGPRIRPHTDGTPTEHGFVSMLPADGGVRAMWLDGRKGGHDEVEHGDDHGAGADMTLRSAVVYADGRLNNEAEIDGRVCECCGTSAVAIGDHVLLAYRNRDPEEIRDITLADWSAGTWSTPRPLHEDHWKIAGCPVNGPALAAFDQGVVAVWYSAAGDSPQVRAMFSDDGGASFGEPFRIDEGEPIGRVGAVMLDARTAVITWIENSKEGAAIRMRLLDASGNGETGTVAGTSSSRSSGFPQVVRADGRLVFAWTEPGDVSQVHVATMPLR